MVGEEPMSREKNDSSLKRTQRNSKTKDSVGVAQEEREDTKKKKRIKTSNVFF